MASWLPYWTDFEMTELQMHESLINKFHLVCINRLHFLNDKEPVPQEMNKVRMRLIGLREGRVLKVRVVLKKYAEP